MVDIWDHDEGQPPEPNPDCEDCELKDNCTIECPFK